jgi:HJR/Mrr/RecB family endonuclease
MCGLLKARRRTRRPCPLANDVVAERCWTEAGLDSLGRMTWREFEMLVGEDFRRSGYSVKETGLGGADGGIDLTLQKLRSH